MHHSAVIDWRVWKAATVAADAPPAKKGDVLYVVSHTTEPHEGPVTFITPGPAQLALNIAIQAALEAEDLRKGIAWQGTGGPSSPKWVDKDNLGKLFSYFERSMVAVTFAFQSLESYANTIIVQTLNGTMKLKRKNGDVDWDASQIERNCSTEEKLAVVLPALGKMKTPKGTKVWENFVKLKDIRDATIHVKDIDQYAGAGEDHKRTLHHQLLNHEPREYPRRAIAMMRIFTPKGSDSWLVPAEELLKP